LAYQPILLMESTLQGSEQMPNSRGIPVRALVWSAGLHLLAIGLLAPHWAGESAGLAPMRVLQGRLLTTASGLPEKQVAEPLSAKPRQPLPAAITTTRPQAAVLPEPTIASSPHAAASETGGVPAIREAVTPATVAMAADVREPAPDAAGLRQYRLALAGEARRYKRYPEAARRNGLSGVAEVRVAVESVGQERLTELARSSGHAMLDAAALDMMRLAAARTSLPESLRGQRFAVLLPVVFEVEN
jgi:periplasmic protein TonB